MGEDADVLGNEAVDEARRKGMRGVVFKLDFEKAYDSMKWDFRDMVLEKKGKEMETVDLGMPL